MKTRILSLAFLAAVAAPAFAQTVTLVGWNFDNSTTGTGGAPGVFNTTGSTEIYNATSKTLTLASLGVFASSATVNFTNLAGSLGGTSANNNWGSFQGVTPGTTTAALGALAVIGSGNNGKYVDFTFSTQGYTSIHISYDTRGTVTGFATQTWTESTNGVDFSSLTAISGRNVTSWSSQGFDALVLNNQATVTLRLAVSGATSTSGNNRIDNFTVTGVAIPEPSTYAALFGAAALGFAVVRRLRRKGA